MNDQEYKIITKLSSRGKFSELEFKKFIPSGLSSLERKALLSNLIKDKFLTYFTTQSKYEVSEFGKSELKKYELESEQNKEDKALTRIKLETDTINSLRIKKTYWWTFGMSVIAFIISVFLLILKIIEWTSK